MAGNDDFSRFLEQRRKLGELSGQDVDSPLFQRQVERAYKKGQRYDPKLAIEIKQATGERGQVRKVENLFPQQETPKQVKIIDRGIIRGRCEIDIHNGGLQDALSLVDTLPPGVWVWIKAYGIVSITKRYQKKKGRAEEEISVEKAWLTLLPNTPKEQVRTSRNIKRISLNLSDFDTVDKICVSYREPRSRR